ncbi:hypothetical protein [Kitasatospora sp. NPDC050543]|uniref:hypothetical protein n=1 Tax=Kitasatospora sp. NPDC050543 TaxID=3364054 RepID=UPI00379F5D09
MTITAPARRAYELDDARSRPANGEDGVHLAGWAERVGLLMLGNGPPRAGADGARRPDPRADEIDAGIAAALASGDADGFFPDMDPDLAREIGVSGPFALAAPRRGRPGPDHPPPPVRRDRGQRRLLRGDLVTLKRRPR